MVLECLVDAIVRQLCLCVMLAWGGGKGREYRMDGNFDAELYFDLQYFQPHGMWVLSVLRG